MWGWSGIKSRGGCWGPAVGPSGWEAGERETSGTYGWGPAPGPGICRSIHREHFCIHHVGRGLILDGTLHYRLTHHITRNMNALWDMLVGEVENGNFGPLVLTGNCVTDIWKHCGCLPAQSFEYVVKTELFTFFCTWKYFSLLLSTVAPNCLLVIAVAQQHLMSSVIFHFFQNRVLSVPIDSFFYFVCFLVSLNVSLCFHSSLFFCCL